MKRVFEFIPSDHDIIVSRTLVLVHQAIDSAFPEAKPASQRFAKTAFGDEPTLTKSLPGERSKAPTFGEESTQPRSISPTESVDEEELAAPPLAPQKLWKHSVIAIVFLILCVIFIYLIMP